MSPNPFTTTDLRQLTDRVVAAWEAGANRDWSVRAGTLEWTCTRTADHAVDTVFAPAFFLASRRLDDYPDMGAPFSAGRDAGPEQVVQALRVATEVLIAVVCNASPADRAVLFRRPRVMVGAPEDFVPRGATELILHAHDVCLGLQIDFEPPADLCRRLREHTRAWPMWTVAWNGLPCTDDPWDDLLVGSGRSRGNTSAR